MTYSIHSSDKKYRDVLFYGGKFTDTDLLPIVLRAKTDYKASYIGAAGIIQPSNYRLGIFNFETEVHSVKHFGKMNHFEINAFYVARIQSILGFPMSIAIGEGLSLASENPKLENKKKGIYFGNEQTDFYTGTLAISKTIWIPEYTRIQKDSIQSRNILNYVMIELDYGFPSLEYFPRVFIRIHHRSGVFGLYCPPDPACGSNFVSYGLKLRIE